MADLTEVLPNFNLKPYSHLLHSLDKYDVVVSDLLTLDPVEIAKRCPLPLKDVRSLVRDIIEAMQKEMNMVTRKRDTSSIVLDEASKDGQARAKKAFFREEPVLKILDPAIDTALGNGLRTGHVIEIVGER